ncbi:MAG: Uncharacterised protein [Rhodospirillaceae bacterium]|nr:MAG: Uncharacterised protein [Rhodospirillaceae bacterium]
MDHDRSFGISYEEFAEYVQKKFECLPVIASGSYALGSSGLAITASYDSEDNGGKVAAKMSF